jgi:type II secretory pathway pseudopilin PulG
MRNTIPFRSTNHSEDGYLLVWVMFLLVVFTIGLSVAMPSAIKEIQRDRELETMNRGKQYIRAVQLYYRKFRAYPPNANALVNTNEIHFLRKKYIDPTTGKDDWKPIRFGEAKTQTTGFFGQPIAGTGVIGSTVLAGTGPSGTGGLGSGSSMGSSFGGSSFGGSNIGGSSIGGSSTGNSSIGGTTTGTVGSIGNSGATGTAGSSGSTSAFGSSNQTFGGAGIQGFSPASTKTSILIYRKKQHYNEWEFVYDPLTDTRTQSGNTGSIGQPASSTTTPVGGSNNGFGFGPGSGSSGGGFGTSNGPPSGAGSPPESPAPPQSPPR